MPSGSENTLSSKVDSTIKSEYLDESGDSSTPLNEQSNYYYLQRPLRNGSKALECIVAIPEKNYESSQASLEIIDTSESNESNDSALSDSK